MTRSPDRWHRWLLDVRFGGDADYRDRNLAEFLYPVRDTVLANARVGSGDTLLDVGTGDGLIAFGALDRVGPAGRVIFSDISTDLLEHCRQAAETEGVAGQCRFVQASADHLAGVAGESVDAVTTRSVLIYVKDKATALREFHRVLRPGGRVSLFEPINVLMSVEDPCEFAGYDVTPVTSLAARVARLYRSIQPRDDDPMVDFDERDMVRHAIAAGFEDVELELRVRVRARKEPVPWDRFLLMSGNPLIPPIGDAVEQVLTPAEATEFYRHLRPLVESGTGTDRQALAYLTAVKMITGDSQ
ncbi:MAG: class I SAM-dependent methyltransferase [Streptosporangiaceae bacterium]